MRLPSSLTSTYGETIGGGSAVHVVIATSLAACRPDSAIAHWSACKVDSEPSTHTHNKLCYRHVVKLLTRWPGRRCHRYQMIMTLSANCAKTTTTTEA